MNNQMDDNQHLQIRSNFWNYKEHINFTCVVYFQSIRDHQIPFIQAIFIDVIDYGIKYKSGFSVQDDKFKVSIDYSFVSNDKMLQINCLENKMSSI